MSDAQSRYDRAMSNIRKGLTFAQGATGEEATAASAYREMVRAGAALPIKRKYSNGRHLKKVR